MSEEEEIKTIPLGTFYVERGYYSIKELEDLVQMFKRFNKEQHVALNKILKRMMEGDKE